MTDNSAEHHLPSAARNPGAHQRLTPTNGTPTINVPAASNGQPHQTREVPATRADVVQVAPRQATGSGGVQPQPRVRGRIDVADEVVEKVAAAAAYEVEGVADLGGDVPRALERMRERIGIGRRNKRDDSTIGVDIDGGEAEIDVAVTVKYGHAIVDVARRVQVNVAHQAHLMLGLKVTAVNVSIDDIEMPEDALTYKDDEDGDRNTNSGFSIAT